MLLRKAAVPSSLTTTVAASLAVATGGVAFYRSTAASTTCSQCDDDGPGDDNNGFRIESHLMEKIAQKPYLANAKDQIPSTFRVLAIDIKEMRTEAFTGTCRLSHDKIFPEEVAPPREINMPTSADNNDDGDNSTNSRDKKRTRRKHKMTIPQKALVKDIFHCSSPQSQQPVGVELLEASIADLNPYKLRKKQRIGGWEYDPGKYYEADDTGKYKESGTQQKTAVQPTVPTTFESKIQIL